MSPADLIEFTKVKLRDGTEVKALVEPPQREPVSRLRAFELILGASLIFTELEQLCLIQGRDSLARRMQDLRHRMADAMDREKSK